MSISFESSAPSVLVTRPAEDAPALANALGRAGYAPVIVPLLERRWDLERVFLVAEQHPEPDWVLVTSGTVADLVATAAPGAWRTARWAAVGRATARRLEQLGFRVDVVPASATAVDLVGALVDRGVLEGRKVIYPRADLASSAPLEALRKADAEIVEVVAYRNVAPEGYAGHVARALPVDATTLMSGSAAERLAAAVPPTASHRRALGQIVCIGPSTARAARHAGLTVHAVAHPHSLSGLLTALQQVLGA